MPIRITCPSCSATLSVKDEYAGRAVKCPKCGGVIPASQPAPAEPEPSAPAASSPPPAPPPAPEKAPHEDTDEPAKPAKTGGKVVGKPVSRSKGADDEEGDRPRKKRDDDDDRDTRSKEDEEEKGGKGEKRSRDDRDRDDDERGDRPKRRRRDEDEDRPTRGEKKQGGANVPLILGIVGFFLLACCGGVGYGIYWFVNKTKETVEKGVDDLQRALSPVTQANYDQLKVGTTTRTQAEQTLGKGRIATGEDIGKVFGTDADRIDEWMSMVVRQRAVIWQNGDDYILGAFYPNAEGASRLQLKAWRPKNGANLNTGEPNDTAFLRTYPPGKKPVDPPIGGGKEDEPPPGPLTEVTAENLVKEFQDDEAAALAKYKDKWFLIEGKVYEVTSGPPDENDGNSVIVKLLGVKLRSGTNFGVSCYVRPEETRNGWDTARGQTVKFRGKVTGGGMNQLAVYLKHCRIDSKDKDPALNSSATVLITEFTLNGDAATKKYKDKEVKITNARFESLAGDLAIFTTTSKKGATIKLQVRFTGTPIRKLEELKPNQLVTFRARSGGLFGDIIANYDAYIVP